MPFPGKLELSPTADCHVHLRDGEMLELVAPTIEQGGCDTIYVMPNLIPPLTTISAVQSYRKRIQTLVPHTRLLMTLYLHTSFISDPSIISSAAAAGIAGVKAYPAGVTTNSSSGVVDLKPFWPVFEKMQEHDLVLNLHGEVPSTPADACGCDVGEAVTVLNAEPRFLPTLREIHAAFPRLRIVLEHCTTKEAVEAIKACGPTVAATITAHHLWITVDDWAGNAFNYCKPVAKTPADRIALIKAIADPCGKFFFGSDSAPHPLSSKSAKPAAGVFTQPYVTQTVVAAVEEGSRQGWLSESEATQEVLEEFLSRRGRKFYKIDDTQNAGRKIVLEKGEERVMQRLKSSTGSGLEVVPFRAGKEVWSLTWENDP